MQATYDDANLILRLYDLRREPRMREARKWFVTNFHATTVEDQRALCPAGSDADAFARMVVTYYEMVASFINSGVLNAELYFQSGGELALVYIRVAPLLTELRATMGNNGIYKNLEAIGKNYGEYVDKHSPGAFAAFQNRVSKPKP